MASPKARSLNSLQSTTLNVHGRSFFFKRQRRNHKFDVALESSLNKALHCNLYLETY